MISSSYSPEQLELITGLVKTVNPKIAFEIGTQQGGSAIAIGQGLSKHSMLITCDRFHKTYSSPPYKETHACLDRAIRNISQANLKCTWEIYPGSFEKRLLTIEGKINLLHIDVCNHRDNLFPIFNIIWNYLDRDYTILLEGGTLNDWQKKYNFSSYKDTLVYLYELSNEIITFSFSPHRALTIMRPKNGL